MEHELVDVDGRERQREQGRELMHRISDSGYTGLISWGGHPAWLPTVVSQILALAGEERIIHAGHTLEDYDGRSVLEGAADKAEGTVQVLTDKLLVVTEFSAQRVRTTALPLRSAASVAVTRISDVRGPAGAWPDRMQFEMTIGGQTFSFPASKAASQLQYAEIPEALAAVLAATTAG